MAELPTEEDQALWDQYIGPNGVPRLNISAPVAEQPLPSEPTEFDNDPFVRAAERLRRRHQQFPVYGPPAPEKPPSYLIEPDLLEAQQGQHLPTNMAYNDAGIPFNRETGVEIPTVRRPNILPVASTPEGPTFAMPKVLDLVGNLMGGVAGAPVKAGEVLLGSGPVRKVVEEATSGPFFSALEKAVNNSKVGKASADQWLGYLKNQPGVKSEEIATVLRDLPEGPITKEQLGEIVKSNKVSLGEVVKYQEPSKEAQKIYDAKAKIVDDAADKLDEAMRKNYGSTSFTFQGNKIYGDELSHALYSGDIKPHELPTELQSVGKELADAFKARESARNDLKNMNNDKFQSKYHGYQLPGAEPGSYKEMLLTLPEKKYNPEDLTPLSKDDPAYNKFENLIMVKAPDNVYQIAKSNRADRKIETFEDAKKYILENKKPFQPEFKSSHWPDEVNPVAHTRYNERVINGKKGLHVEENQSDLHQQGRDQGYKGEKEKLQPQFDKIEEKILASNDEAMLGLPTVKGVLKEAVDKKIITKEEADTYKRYTDIENQTPVPDFPFKKNWEELVWKRMLHEAAVKGHDFLSWTPGEAQALRYQNDIRQKLKTIGWSEDKVFAKYRPDGRTDLKRIEVDGQMGKTWIDVDKNGDIIHAQNKELKDKTIDAVLGKDLAKQVMEKSHGTIDAKNYVMGAEGMKQAYDKRAVDILNNLAKKYGSKVEQREISSNENKNYHIDLNEGPQAGNYPFAVYFENNSGEKRFLSAYKTKKEANDAIAKIGFDRQPIHYLPITPELRQKAKEGFPLFSTSPTLTAVQHDPFQQDQNKKYKLVPIQGNPFQ